MGVGRRTFVAMSLGLAFAPRATSAEYGVIKIVYPFGPGGAGDAVVRLLAEHLGRALDRPVVVMNVTGAGGQIGARSVKGSPADGSMLLFAAAAQMTLQPHIVTDLGYDAFRDFDPIAQVVRFDQVVAVSAKVPAHSIGGLVDWLRANPDRATFGSPGVGTGAHLAGLALARTFDLPLRHVPYRGTPDALPDVLAGRVAVLIASRAELIQHHELGTIRILATADAQRASFQPDVPTLRELGVDIDAPAWFALYAPAGTPQQLVQRLERAIGEILRLPDVRSPISTMRLEPVGTTAEELRHVQAMQFERWGNLVKRLAFKLE